ncbi:hypothetical protein BHE74_00038474 [Ensete ventricosum]|nr:hypothetical protein BHE74_00038474 [Ensete ventricosum]
MNGNGKQVTLRGKRESEEKIISTQHLEKLAEISSTSKAEAKRIAQETQETDYSATIFPYNYTLSPKALPLCFRDNLLLKCHIQLNQLWLMMQLSQISGYFHYLCSPTDDRKKIGSLQQQYQHGIWTTREPHEQLQIRTRRHGAQP